MRKQRSTPYRLSLSRLVLPLLLGISLLGGCDNTVDPFSKRGVYSIYGFLAVNESIQVVRVKPLTQPLSGDTSTVNATVSLTNLSDGSTTILRDSVITFTDGNSPVPTHNFWADLSVKPGTKYRLTVEREDGATAQATTVTPTGKSPSISPQRGHCRTSFLVKFRGVSEQRLVSASLLFESDSTTYEVPRSETVFESAAGDIVMRITPEQFLSERIASVDDPNTRCEYEPRCMALDEEKIRIKYAYLGPEWFGEAPEDTLRYDPLESEDVTNGLGFFGSIRRDQTSLTVDTTRTFSIDQIGCP